MVVYHGSNHNFKTLKISKSLVRYNSTLENEGLGIYFSTDKSVAESYGKYIYTLDINDKYFIDFRKQRNCITYVNNIVEQIKKITKININNYINTAQVANYMYFGGIAISGVGKEIYMLLDSTEQFYNEISTTNRKKIYIILRKIDKQPPKAYMFNYNIKNVGVIKDVSDDIVKIIDKRSAY